MVIIHCKLTVIHCKYNPTLFLGIGIHCKIKKKTQKTKDSVFKLLLNTAHTIRKVKSILPLLVILIKEGKTTGVGKHPSV